MIGGGLFGFTRWLREERAGRQRDENNRFNELIGDLWATDESGAVNHDKRYGAIMELQDRAEFGNKAFLNRIFRQSVGLLRRRQPIGDEFYSEPFDLAAIQPFFTALPLIQNSKMSKYHRNASGHCRKKVPGS